MSLILDVHKIVVPVEDIKDILFFKNSSFLSSILELFDKSKTISIGKNVVEEDE